MTRTYSLAAALCLLATAPSAAATITAADGAGRVYQLNEDGTYRIIVKGEDGKTYLLAPDGTWWDEDEDTALNRRFIVFLEAAQKNERRRAVAEDWPKYRDCLAAAFRDLELPARRVIVSASDPGDALTKLEKAHPEAVKVLGDRDSACRRDIRFE